MTVRERQIDDVTLIDVDGRITEEDGAALLCDTVHRLAGEGRTKLVINLLDTPYIDSAAMGEIVCGYTTVTRRGGILKLLQPQPRVRELLTITRLSTVLEIYDSEREAVASFRG